MTKLDDTITITIDGKEHQLLMSFGLLNRLMKKADIHIDSLLVGGAHEIRDELFVMALNKRGKSGAFENFSADRLDEIDMDSETAQRLLLWILGHIVDFLLGVAEKATHTHQKFAARMEALTQSAAGTKN